MLRPHLENKNGTGTRITAKHPKIVFPQSTPMLRYMGPIKRGNAPANIARRNMLAATALALYLVNVSTR